MNISQQTLLDLLEADTTSNSLPPAFYSLQEHEQGFLSPIEMANLFTNSALLRTVMTYLKDELWLKSKNDKDLGIVTSYKKFITPLFDEELAPLIFLQSFLTESGAKNIKKVAYDTQVIEAKILALILKRSKSDIKSFATQSLNNMLVHYIAEEKAQEGKIQSNGHQGLELYRTFDNLDDIFGLNYKLDIDMLVDPDNKERLYAGAGVGVQSGYSTILLALHNMDLKEGSKVIDLGSGYGRVGLAIGLVRPDIEFVGYEYVKHRVDISNVASEKLGLQEKLSFITQDLSIDSFKIPDADVYYLYDPFSKETYDYILNQIVKLSKTKQLTIVTKGNARSWLTDIAQQNSWPKPIHIDEGNLCIFKTRNSL